VYTQVFPTWVSDFLAPSGARFLGGTEASEPPNLGVREPKVFLVKDVCTP